MLATKDSEVVESFVKYINEYLYMNIKIDSIPENFNDGDIDAIAGNFAIEHTSVDTIKNQRRESDWFSQSVDGIEEYFENILPYRLNILINYVDIKKGQIWKNNNSVLRAWIKHKSSDLSYEKNQVVDISGLNFKVKVSKYSKNEFGSGVRFVRVLSSTYDPDSELPTRMKVHLKSKLQKLGKYKNHLKILLIENSDLALMNTHTMIEYINRSFDGKLPVEVDEVWYADSSMNPDIKFNKVSFE